MSVAVQRAGKYRGIGDNPSQRASLVIVALHRTSCGQSGTRHGHAINLVRRPSDSARTSQGRVSLVSHSVAGRHHISCTANPSVIGCLRALSLLSRSSRNDQGFGLRLSIYRTSALSVDFCNCVFCPCASSGAVHPELIPQRYCHSISLDVPTNEAISPLRIGIPLPMAMWRMLITLAGQSCSLVPWSW